MPLVATTPKERDTCQSRQARDEARRVKGRLGARAPFAAELMRRGVETRRCFTSRDDVTRCHEQQTDERVASSRCGDLVGASQPPTDN